MFIYGKHNLGSTQYPRDTELGLILKQCLKVPVGSWEIFGLEKVSGEPWGCLAQFQDKLITKFAEAQSAKGKLAKAKLAKANLAGVPFAKTNIALVTIAKAFEAIFRLSLMLAFLVINWFDRLTLSISRVRAFLGSTYEVSID